MKDIKTPHEQLIHAAHQEVKNKREAVKNHHHRSAFHLDPPTGWMNDPNGLVYFQDAYHVFYQSYPYAAENGPKHWGHFRSRDLINWEITKPALAPGENYDKDGCYSGSAVSHNDELVILYTGHVEDKSPKEVQCLATSRDGIHFTKSEWNPVIEAPPSGFSEDFRDPKVFRRNDKWFMVTGNAQDGNGQVLLYSSDDLRHWNEEGVFAESDGSQGFMWECPDFVEVDGQDLLILSPEGMDGVRHKSVYLRGKMDNATKRFTQDACYMLDYGSDFYAPQTLTDDQGRVILFGWMNLWESAMPTASNGWVGTMTIPRELRMGSDGKLLQIPAEELKNLRTNEEHLSYTLQSEEVLKRTMEYGEIELAISRSEALHFGIKLRCAADGSEETVIGVDLAEKNVYIDRSKSGEGDTERFQAPAEFGAGPIKLRIFLDRSSVEVFINDGETVLTSRIYPKKDSISLKLFTDSSVEADLHVYDLNDKMMDMKIMD